MRRAIAGLPALGCIDWPSPLLPRIRFLSLWPPRHLECPSSVKTNALVSLSLRTSTALEKGSNEQPVRIHSHPLSPFQRCSLPRSCFRLPRQLRATRQYARTKCLKAGGRCIGERQKCQQVRMFCAVYNLPAFTRLWTRMLRIVLHEGHRCLDIARDKLHAQIIRGRGKRMRSRRQWC